MPAVRSGLRPGNATSVLRISSYVLMAGALLLLMLAGLLPGLLFACLGFLATRWLAELLARLQRTTRLAPRLPRWAQVLAATLGMVAPLLLRLPQRAVRSPAWPCRLPPSCWQTTSWPSLRCPAPARTAASPRVTYSVR